MSLTDCRGVPISTSSRTSLDRLEAATELSHGYSGDPLTVADKAIAEEPNFVMGYCLRASLLLIALDGALNAQIEASIGSAQRLLVQANERERLHIAALRAWVAGEIERAGAIYDQILSAFPLDTLALQMGHNIDYVLGTSEAMLKRVESILPFWHQDVPGYGYVLGMHAFGLEETGHFAEAEDAGLHALGINARDAWAVHALAHVYESDGRQSAGIECLTTRARDWAVDNTLAVHNWWHVALYHFDLGEIERVLQLYDSSIRTVGSNILMDLVDASALLWRLNLLEVDVSARAAELAGSWEAALSTNSSAFATAHAMMAFALADRQPALRGLLEWLEHDALRADAHGDAVRAVALPACRAFQAFAAGDFRTATALLEQAWPNQRSLGGSNAQRDILATTLIESASRAGLSSLATELANRRVLARPRSPFARKLAKRAAGE